MLCQVLSQMQVRHFKSQHDMRFNVLTIVRLFFLSCIFAPPSIGYMYDT